ncbi:hypothetical protein ACA910_019449 [Epithemia clementina (nom. ined.)]
MLMNNRPQSLLWRFQFSFAACWRTAALVATTSTQVHSRFCRAMSSTSSSASLSTTRKCVVAVAQMCSTADKVQNLIDIAVCAGRSQHYGAQMLFLPEACGFMGATGAETVRNAEPPIGNDLIAKKKDDQFSDHESSQFKNPSWLTERLEHTIRHNAANDIEDKNTKKSANDEDVSAPCNHSTEENGTTTMKVSLVDGLQTIARASRIWISAGGVHVLCNEPGGDDKDRDANRTQQPRVYNTHLILDSSGEIRALYRKIHLFEVSIPGQVELSERKHTAPGHEIVLCDTPIGRIGVTTCYDVRFPELYVKLVEQGAQILLVPSAFTVPTGKAHWHLLLRARAVESQSYVIAAAQYGSPHPKRSSYGHSLVVDPWGVVVADAGGVDSAADISTPSIVTAEIDLDHLDSIRQRLPIQQNRASAQYEK